MSEIEEEILKLTNIWCRFAGTDHHKDRDCHFYINRRWSYGEKPYYQAEHWGYLEEFEGTKCETEEEALEELRDLLLMQIHNSKIWVTRNLNEIVQILKEDPEKMYLGSVEEYVEKLAILNEA